MTRKMTIMAAAALALLLILVVALLICADSPTVTPVPDSTEPYQTESAEQQPTESEADTQATEPVESTQTTVPLTTDPSNPIYASEGVENWEENAGGGATAPTATEPQPTENGTSGETDGTGTLTWEQYLNMTLEEQQAFDISFGLDEAGRKAFFAWRNAAREEYEKAHSYVTGDGNVNIEDFMGGGN